MTPPQRPRDEVLQAPHELSAVLRLKAGLCPLRAIEDVTVNASRYSAFLDNVLDMALGGNAAFGIVEGTYGTGKTHFLQLAREKALKKGAAIAQLSADSGQRALGHPQRHVCHLIAGLQLPSGMTLASFLSRAQEEDQVRSSVVSAVEPLTKGEFSDLAFVVLQALSSTIPRWDAKELIDESMGFALAGKPSSPSARWHSYHRLQFWISVVLNMGCTSILLLLDEIENLFQRAVCPSVSSRRAAYRTLSFYTSLKLRKTSVLWAMTPDGRQELMEEYRQEFSAVAAQLTRLDEYERIQVLGKRLSESEPLRLKPLKDNDLRELAELVIALHGRARGVSVKMEKGTVDRLQKEAVSARDFCKALCTLLDEAWFEAAS